MRVDVQRNSPAALRPGNTQYPMVQEVGWDPGPVRADAEDLARTGIRSQGRPARSKSLYRLSYPGPQSCLQRLENIQRNLTTVYTWLLEIFTCNVSVHVRRVWKCV